MQGAVRARQIAKLRAPRASPAAASASIISTDRGSCFQFLFPEPRGARPTSRTKDVPAVHPVHVVYADEIWQPSVSRYLDLSPKPTPAPSRPASAEGKGRLHPKRPLRAR